MSSYYAWKKRPESAREQENQRIVAEIKLLHKQSRETYGSPRIYHDLKGKGIACSENPIARLMKKHEIAAKRKRKFVVTTDSKHNLPVAENKLNQDFTAANPNEKWVTDLDLHVLEHRVHVCVDQRRVVIPSRSVRLIFTKSSGLGDGC